MMTQTRRAMSRTETGITWRSVTLGLVLAGALCALTPYNDYVVQNTYIAGSHFPVGAAFVLVSIALVNLLLRRYWGRSLVSGREMAVVYILIVVTSGIPSSGLLRYLIPSCVTPHYFANPGNQWESLIWSHFPSWLRVNGPEAVPWFWEGLPEGASVPWDAWWSPLLHSAILFGSLWMLMICLAALLRRQWEDRERLTFPLVQFPLAVVRDSATGPSAGFFSGRLLWGTALAVLAIHVVNGLHAYYPTIPPIPTFWDLHGYLADRPWEAAQPLYLGVFFSTVGFAYLLSLEVAAGFWTSVLLVKLEGVLLSVLGYEGTSAWSGTISKITTGEQMGGLLMVAAVLIWLLRGALYDAFRSAFLRAPRVDDSHEPLSYRVAVFGLLVSSAIATSWLCAACMSLLFACLLLLLFLCMSLVLTRIVAEAGMLMVHFNYWPVTYLTLFGGAGAVGAGNLAAIALLDSSLSFDMRELLMPSVLNGFCLAERSAVPTRRLTPILGVALVVGLVVSVPAFLATIYNAGALNNTSIVDLSRQPRLIFGELGDRLQNPESPGGVGCLSVLAGAGIVAALSWLRLNFVWWPIHPLGFVMATSWAGLNLWFSLFLGWLVKLLTLRYTGLRGYVRLQPLFFGLILGDVLGAVFWICVGFFTKIGIMVTVN